MEFYFLREFCNAFFVYTLWFYLYKYSSWLALTQQFFETSTVGSQLCIILYSPLLVFSKKVIARNRIITQFFWETKIIFFFFFKICSYWIYLSGYSLQFCSQLQRTVWSNMYNDGSPWYTSLFKFWRTWIGYILDLLNIVTKKVQINWN